jgi:Flp pilus assembly protein TadG
MNLSRRADPRRGTAALEFALLLPVLLILLVATAEVMAYVRAVHRLERTAAEVASATSQIDAATQAELGGLFATANVLASPQRAWSTSTDPAGTARARTFISVVAGSANGNGVAWSCARGDSGRLARLVSPPGSVTLPNGFQVPAGQTVVVVEIVSTVRAWMLTESLFGTAAPAEIRTHAILRPRQTQLSSLSGGCPA